MKHYNIMSKFTSLVKIILTLTIIAILHACASTSETDTAAGETTAASASESSTAESAGTAAATEAAADSSSSDSGAVSTQAKAAAPAVEPEKIEPPRIVESCKDEPYTKYEQQSRESIQKGLAATKEGKFGVGFRDVEEHNKWSKIHNSLFKSVNDACGVLAECAKTHKKDKDTECVTQAKAFGEWQKLAKSFAEQAKTAETTQPPKICSPTPDLADPPRCFHALADNVDKVCGDSDACKEISDCWRGVGFLDAAISQAAQACGFVHQKLSDCRGYTEATGRREKKFAQCQELMGRQDITVLPVL